MNVISIGDVRIKRGVTITSCRHNSLTYDTSEKIVQCNDCKAFLDPFSAFVKLVSGYELAYAKLKTDQDMLKDAKEKESHLLAAKKVEEVWRSRNFYPACPHCRSAIAPGDNLGDLRVSKDFELKRRSAATKES